MYRNELRYELLSTEKADIDRGEILGGLAPPLAQFASEILPSLANFGLTVIGTNPEEVGSLNACNIGGDICEPLLNELSEFDVIDPTEEADAVAPGDDAFPWIAAAAAAAACCC